MMFTDFALEYAWLIPTLKVSAFLLIGLFFREQRHVVVSLSLGTSFLSLLLAVGVLYGVLTQGISMEVPLCKSIDFVVVGEMHLTLGTLIDPLTAMMLLVVTSVSFLVEIYSVEYMQDEAGFGRFFAYISLFSASMLALVLATNFVEMYIFWELVGLCSYLLIGFYFKKDSAREAAKKAFMTTRIGDFGLLVGILLLHFEFLTTEFFELKVLIAPYIATFGTFFLSVIAFLIFLGVIAKSGQFPLHVWLPDAMEGPTPVSALIHAATMVVAGVYLVARAYFLFAKLPFIMFFIACLGAFTALFGALIALTQRQIKRILAYSTISQLGYMILALGVGSLTASMFHLFTHAFFKALLFLGAGAVMHAMLDEADIFKMGGLRKKLPVTFFSMSVGVLAISGIFPFAGFFSKDEILKATLEYSVPLYVMATLTATLTAFYMSRLLFVVFFGEEKHTSVVEHYTLMKIPLLVLAFFAICSGVVAHWCGFGEWIYYGSKDSGQIDFSIALTSTVLSLVGIFFSYQLYVAKRWSVDVLCQRLGFLYRLSYNKFYVDEYFSHVRRLLCELPARFIAWFDFHIIDGVVNLLAYLVKRLSYVFTYLHSGEVERSLAVYFSGVIVLLAYGFYVAYQLFFRVGGAF